MSKFCEPLKKYHTTPLIATNQWKKNFNHSFHVLTIKLVDFFDLFFFQKQTKIYVSLKKIRLVGLQANT